MWKRSVTCVQGLALLKTLPETPERPQREVDMQIALGGIVDCHQRLRSLLRSNRPIVHARQLCQHLEDPSPTFPRVAWTVELLSRACRASRRRMHWAEQLSTWRSNHDPAMLLAAHRALGATLFYLGAVATAHTHLRRGSPSTIPSSTVPRRSCYGEDAGVICHSLMRLGAVVSGLSGPGAGAEPARGDAGTADCPPF